MKVFIPQSDEFSELAHPVRPEDFETMNLRINGQRLGDSWRPVEFRLISKDEGRKLTPVVSPWLGSHALILKQGFAPEFEEYLRENGELLALGSDEISLLVFNPGCLADALNEEASQSMRFSDGRIMAINNYVFRADVLTGIAAFKIPSLRVSPTFVTEHFVDKWQAAGITGVHFKCVWSFL